MATAVDLWSDVAGAAVWPARWLTLAEVAAELERFGFWRRPPFQAYTRRERLAFLAGALTGPAWARMGPLYKPAALLTEEDHALRERWLDEYRAGLNEDLSRILLGEPAPAVGYRYAEDRRP